MSTIFHFLFGMCLFYKGMVKEYFVGGWRALKAKFFIPDPLSFKAAHISTSELRERMYVQLTYKNPRELGIQDKSRLTYTRFNPDEVDHETRTYKGSITKITDNAGPLNERLIEFSFFKENGLPRKLLLLESEIEKVIEIDRK